MMGEKKQNINLYKQLANRQDEANRQLEEELNQLKQNSMHANAMNPEDLEAIQREQEELMMLENELKNRKQDQFHKYQNMQWGEDPGYQMGQNILGREAQQNYMIPQTNQGYDQQSEMGGMNNDVMVNDSLRYDDGSALPMESRVINQDNNRHMNPNVFNQPANQSFRNNQEQESYYQETPKQNVNIDLKNYIYIRLYKEFS